MGFPILKLPLIAFILSIAIFVTKLLIIRTLCKMGPYAGSKPSLGSPLCMGHGARRLQGREDAPTQNRPHSTGTWAPWATRAGDSGVLCGEIGGMWL